jgi:hypothetical protein
MFQNIKIYLKLEMEVNNFIFENLSMHIEGSFVKSTYVIFFKNHIFVYLHYSIQIKFKIYIFKILNHKNPSYLLKPVYNKIYDLQILSI